MLLLLLLFLFFLHFPSSHNSGSAAVRYIYRSLITQERDRRREVEANVAAFYQQQAEKLAAAPKHDVRLLQEMRYSAACSFVLTLCPVSLKKDGMVTLGGATAFLESAAHSMTTSALEVRFNKTASNYKDLIPIFLQARREAEAVKDEIARMLKQIDSKNFRPIANLTLDVDEAKVSCFDMKMWGLNLIHIFHCSNSAWRRHWQSWLKRQDQRRRNWMNLKQQQQAVHEIFCLFPSSRCYNGSISAVFSDFTILNKWRFEIRISFLHESKTKHNWTTNHLTTEKPQKLKKRKAIPHQSGGGTARPKQGATTVSIKDKKPLTWFNIMVYLNHNNNTKLQGHYHLRCLELDDRQRVVRKAGGNLRVTRVPAHFKDAALAAVRLH